MPTSQPSSQPSSRPTTLIPCVDGQENRKGECFDCPVGFYSNIQTYFHCAECLYSASTGAANCVPGKSVVIASQLKSEANLNEPYGFVLNNNGNGYLVEHGACRIDFIDIATRNVTVFAGSFCGVGAIDGTGTKATFYSPCGIAIDKNQNIYVADYYFIRFVTSQGNVTTLAGNSDGGYVDGDGTNAGFTSAVDIIVDITGSGNIFISDIQVNAIRKMSPIPPYKVTTLYSHKTLMPNAISIV
jgi:hypothetical protein